MEPELTVGESAPLGKMGSGLVGSILTNVWGPSS